MGAQAKVDRQEVMGAYMAVKIWVEADHETRVAGYRERSQVILPTAPGVSNEGPRSRVLGLLPAVSWPWVPACGSLEPPRRDGENAQKMRKNGEKMGEIQPKTCEPRELTKDQLVRHHCGSVS